MALTSPTKRVDTRRMSDRQRDLLWVARCAGHGTVYVSADDARACGYADASAALGRLVARGLLRRVARGRYVPVVIGERRRPVLQSERRSRRKDDDAAQV